MSTPKVWTIRVSPPQDFDLWVDKGIVGHFAGMFPEHTDDLKTLSQHQLEAMAKRWGTGDSLKNFYDKVSDGDTFIAFEKESGRILGYSTPCGDYRFDAKLNKYRHYRVVQWTIPEFPEYLKAEASIKRALKQNKQKPRTTTQPPNRAKQASSHGATVPEVEQTTSTPDWRCHNIILYGPPGTGKTYAVRDRALDLITDVSIDESDEKTQFNRLRTNGRIDFVTFHQSYGYEDFIEGIRPVLSESGGVGYELHQGVFKRIALRAIAAGLKNAALKEEYDRADSDKTQASIAQKALDSLESGTFEFNEGTPQYVLIIDEINRGNISKIFGELITLLEPDKRLSTNNELRLRLPGSPDHLFGVPPNLHIIGTMNTADRSIALMDVALRRRFTFEEMMPSTDVIRDRFDDEAPLGDLLCDLLTAINERIVFLYDHDHQIGHAYFLRVNNLEDLRQVFLDRIIPLLQEYFYGEWDKICIVLGCPYKDNGSPRRAGMSHEYAMISVVSSLDLRALGLEDGGYEQRLGYEVNPNFKDPSRQNLDSEGFLVEVFLGVLTLGDQERKHLRGRLLSGRAPT